MHTWQAEASGPLGYFELYIDEEMSDLMVAQTNMYAGIRATATDRRWKPVDGTNICNYLATNVTFGLLKLPSLKEYWSSDPFWQVTELLQNKKTNFNGQKCWENDQNNTRKTENLISWFFISNMRNKRHIKVYIFWKFNPFSLTWYFFCFCILLLWFLMDF